MATAGRPALPREQVLRNSVTLRLTDEEYDALLAAAGDLRPATYAREVLVRHLKRRGQWRR